MLTGAEDGSAFLSNIQSGRILGQLHGTTPSCRNTWLCHLMRVHSSLGWLELHVAVHPKLPGTAGQQAHLSACRAHRLYRVRADVDRAAI